MDHVRGEGIHESQNPSSVKLVEAVTEKRMDVPMAPCRKEGHRINGKAFNVKPLSLPHTLERIAAIEKCPGICIQSERLDNVHPVFREGLFQVVVGVKHKTVFLPDAGHRKDVRYGKYFHFLVGRSE